MNTLFRVLYTVVIQWRTYMMVCGPEGGWGCFSLMDREMVRKPDKCTFHLVYYCNEQDCAWMTGLILLTALDSLFFCALTSILRFAHVTIHPLLCDPATDSSTFAQVSRTKFRESSKGMLSPLHFLSWAFSTASSTSSSLSMTRRRLESIACAWFSTTPAWTLCPSSPRPWSRWCPSVSCSSTEWTLSTSPATSIFTCISRSRERQIQVKVKGFFDWFTQWPPCSAIMVSDMRKERKRNLLPAWVGIYGILVFLAHTIAWQAAFAIKVGLQQHLTKFSITNHSFTERDGQLNEGIDCGFLDRLLLLPLLPGPGPLRLSLSPSQLPAARRF